MPTIRWVHVPKIQSFPNIEKGLKSHDKNVLNVFQVSINVLANSRS